MAKPNIDPLEVEKFQLDEESWWDLDGEHRTLHQINPLRTEYINKRSPVKGKKVLDIGCGGGILTESLAELGAKVTGIDVAENALKAARQHSENAAIDIDYVQSTAEDFSAANQEAFDIVTCMEVIEHVPDPESIVVACAKLTKPGGSVFFSTLNRNFKGWLFGIVGAEHVLHLLPSGTHRYDRFIRPSELNRMCFSSNLVINDLSGIHYNLLTKNFRIGPGVEVNYLSHCTRH